MKKRCLLAPNLKNDNICWLATVMQQMSMSAVAECQHLRFNDFGQKIPGYNFCDTYFVWKFWDMTLYRCLENLLESGAHRPSSRDTFTWCAGYSHISIHWLSVFDFRQHTYHRLFFSVKPGLHIVAVIVSTVENMFPTLSQAVLMHVDTFIVTSQALPAL